MLLKQIKLRSLLDNLSSAWTPSDLQMLLLQLSGYTDIVFFCLFALAVTFLASRFVVRTETHTLSKQILFLRQPPELYPRSLFIINLPALISDAPQVCALCFAYSVCDGKLARPRGGGGGDEKCVRLRCSNVCLREMRRTGWGCILGRTRTHTHTYGHLGRGRRHTHTLFRSHV